MAALLITAQPAWSATTRLVDADTSATSTSCDQGTPGTAFPTISAAVTGADPGDTIKVCPGTYDEQVTVDKALTLIGGEAGVDGRDPARPGTAATESIVRGAGGGAIRTTPFEVTADDVTIDGFTVQDQGDPNNFGSGIDLGAGTSGHVVRNNVVQNNGVGLSLGSDATTIERNFICCNNNSAGAAAGTGIYTDQSRAGGTLNNVTIRDNELAGNLKAAVLFGSTNPAQPAAGVAVYDNTIRDNGDGFRAYNWVNSSFTRNVVIRMWGSGVVLGGGVANASVDENVIASATSRGIVVADRGGGADNSSISIRCNSITDHKAGGLEVERATYSGSLTAAFNWWGHASGPESLWNPGGTGQAVYDSSTHPVFTPFLTTGVDTDPATPGFQCVPRARATDVTIAEGDAGATNADVTVTLDNPSPNTVTVAASTQDGTAASGSDYSSTSQTLTFTPGETSKTVRVPVTGDTLPEPDETFAVKLLSPSNAALADDEGTVTITNDDRAPEPPAGPGASNPRPTPDLTAPLASRLRLSPSSFRARAGTTVRYTLSEAATTTFTVERAVAGRVKRGKCRAQSRSNRTGRRCTLFTRVRGSFRQRGAAGANAFEFTGRVGGRTLAPGDYRLSAVPKDAAGNGGKVARAAFRIKR